MINISNNTASMIKAIAVGPYPAPVFNGGERQKEHRRFIRRLANQGTLQLLDEYGTPLDMQAVNSGSLNYKHWYLSQGQVEVLLKEIDNEGIRLAELKKQDEEERRRQDEEQRKQHEEEKRRKKEEKALLRAELRAAGNWYHPLYKTIKAAMVDGWHKAIAKEYGGETLSIKGHTLVRNSKVARYVYKTTLSKTYGLTPAMIEELGEPDKYCDNPHWSNGPAGCLYLIERVEAWVEKHQERLIKAKRSREKRSAVMRGVHCRKRNERLMTEISWLRQLPIHVNTLPGTLLDDARKRFAFAGHAEVLNEKGLHAYVRHRCTNYESLLQEIYQAEFSGDLYPLLRERIDGAVAEALVAWKCGGGMNE